ncbi:MAG: hypothetical protein IPJ34_29060 [Myxococcales bacterium]|nr:hypothetical protein [Myxococcales bacterium]
MRSLAVSAVAAFAALTVGCSPDDHRGSKPGYSEPPPACSAATSCGTCTPLSGCGWCQYEDGTGSCTTSPTRCKTHTFRWNWDPETCPVSDGGVDTGDAEASTDAPSTDAGTDAPSTDAPSTDAPSTDAGTDAPSTDAPSTDAPAEAGDADEVSTDATEEAATDAATDGTAADSAPVADSAPATDTSVATDTGPKCGVDTVPSGCAVSTGGTLCKGTEYTLGCLGAAVPATSAACTKAYAKSGETYYCCPCR